MDDEQVDRLIDAMNRIGAALERLGTNNASTQMGAVEILAMEVREGCARMAAALAERD